MVAVKGLVLYPITQPTDDYLDAEKTGRCKIFCIDIGGHTVACAVIYGWTDGSKGSREAERTDDILSIIRMQFLLMEEGPKLICGDFNATAEALPTLDSMLKEEGWTDVGDDHKICKGNPGQNTCHTNAMAKESRISFFISNQCLTPAIKHFSVEQNANYPTHKPIRIKVATSELKTVTNQLRKPTNYATLFQEKLDKDLAAKKDEAEREAKENNEEPKKVDINAVRKEHTQRLHNLMDKHLEKRKHRLQASAENKNTTRQCDLIAVATEDANIEYRQLTGIEAKKMRGRSRITFQRMEKNNLELSEKQEGDEDLITRMNWLKLIAGQHAQMGNKLLNIAKRIKADALNQQEGSTKRR